MKLELIQGNRAQLEMQLLLKIAEPRMLSDPELQALLAPLQRRAQLALLVQAGQTVTPPSPAQPANPA